MSNNLSSHKYSRMKKISTKIKCISLRMAKLNVNNTLLDLRKLFRDNYS